MLPEIESYLQHRYDIQTNSAEAETKERDITKQDRIVTGIKIWFLPFFVTQDYIAIYLTRPANKNEKEGRTVRQRYLHFTSLFSISETSFSVILLV